MKFDEALAYLDDHASYDKTGRVEEPSLDNIAALMHAMADPHLSYPVVHVTGTNGKGSTTQIITRLLVAHGLKVGTYTSPHLEHLTERICLNGEPIYPQDFADVVAAVAQVEVLAGVRPTYFEIMTAVAFRYFADEAVDVAVIEVGMLGRWDATNVVRSEIAVVTNIDLDHTEFAGPTLEDIAREKVGIAKAESILLVGDENPDLDRVWSHATCSKLVRRGLDFDCIDNYLAIGGRLLTLRTPRTAYTDLHLPLHGHHQGFNASIALSAVEEFFDSELNEEIVREGLASVDMPGRFEVMGHQPLIVIDGAHNPAGAEVCAQVFLDDFSISGSRVLVIGTLRGRDPEEMLVALKAHEFDAVICCTAPSPRAVEADVLARTATAIGCEVVAISESVEDACDRGLSRLTASDALLIAGSLYVVGSARSHLRRSL
jgi:dihydrofolate synthase/folylpolyglutamate synthase